jgi:hypothetical protein
MAAATPGAPASTTVTKPGSPRLLDRLADALRVRGFVAASDCYHDPWRPPPEVLPCRAPLALSS